MTTTAATTTAVTTTAVTTTLITGANKGLGYETARRLIAAGHTVWMGSRDQERGQRAADELGGRYVALDVTNDASVASAAETIAAEGGLDVLINNAGITGPHSAPADLTGDDALQVFNTNVIGVVRTTNAFLPALRQSTAPTIVNVTSGLGSFATVLDPERLESQIVAPLYTSSKSAVTMLTVQYAKAFPEIRINAADPGYTATDLNGKNGTQTVTEGTDAIVELATRQGQGATGTFIDRAGVVLF
ncbi:NAD(P)-dependent dehydrogenase (short-subunit alcohol dehydrogenase family) [Glaciihabitans tibetensis]|uniref:NAD(P)-dependent dehydrogenase (Short-subunit alcohol dehydrogenase family) n=1 Tax=Glaciihabitans tibetensis TaxID=1266600 RepID=A0A2T0VB75_9MICO|nr:SDR family NAD(P)-dependent oxidoreductase [Glaciihabitans tibetensis]PRY67456.1 NAD(P)-dependent dehydrogenase (short-subunit alcohol dehydrogenase family) [Glaciihabitans tibetensis]